MTLPWRPPHKGDMTLDLDCGFLPFHLSPSLHSGLLDSHGLLLPSSPGEVQSAYFCPTVQFYRGFVWREGEAGGMGQ